MHGTDVDDFTRTSRFFQVFDKGLSKEKIVNLSEGLPQYTHSFCKYSTKNAIKNDINIVNLEDFISSINLILEDLNESIEKTYQKAILDVRQNIYEDILIACALAPIDEYNTFTHTDIKTTFSFQRSSHRNYTLMI